jgi:membrane protein required for colicin V production
MAVIDILLLIPILIGAFNGYRKGLLIEIIGIGAFVVAIIFGFKFLSFGAELIDSFIGKETIQKISPYLSFLIIFFPTIFLIRKIGWLMRKSLRMTIFGSLDSFLGAALGGFTALFAVSILVWLISKTSFVFPEKWMHENQLYDFVSVFAPNIISKILDYIPIGGNWIDYLEILKEKFKSSAILIK